MTVQAQTVYRNKFTKTKVRVQSVEGKKVIYTKIGNPGQTFMTSVQDFELKYEKFKTKRK